MKKHASKSISMLLAKTFAGLVVVVLSMYLPQSADLPAASELSRVSAAESTDVWWPVEGSRITGTQPFKALLNGRAITEYEMYWRVDGGQLNRMENNETGYPHKEVAVNVGGWNWRGNGPYAITFRAVDRAGALISEKTLNIWIDSPSVSPTISSTAVSQSKTTVESSLTLNSAQPVAFAPLSVAPSEVNVWWPANNLTLTGIQPLKALLQGTSLSKYEMYWQVDGGQLNPMQDSLIDYPHKEVSVNVSGWTWKGTGPYLVTFVAKDFSGRVLASKSVSVKTGSSKTTVAPQTAPAPVLAPTPSPSQTGNPLEGVKLYVNPNSPAKKQADAWRSSRPTDAAQMDKIASQTAAVWLGGWNANVQSDTNTVVAAAQNQGAVATLIAYNIPQRDCGSYSAGGAGSADAYKSWIRGVAAGIANRKTIVILEPDALAGIDCLNSTDKATRVALLSDAVNVLRNAGAVVYMDAGNSHWIGASEMANRLKSAGVLNANGFSLNVSNFYTDADNIAFGTQLSDALGGAHYVFDTSRNGMGSSGEWCNPSGRALGAKPTTATGNSRLDAKLWLKTPGESDGQCNGGPSAGTWWGDYALGLAQRASW